MLSINSFNNISVIQNFIVAINLCRYLFPFVYKVYDKYLSQKRGNNIGNVKSVKKLLFE